MKLRINGNSIRLRLLRAEVATFIETGCIEAKIHFAPGDQSFLIYRLLHEPGLSEVQLRSALSEVSVAVPSTQAAHWFMTEQTGIYSTVDLGEHGSLKILVEKDFACLDSSDADNHDTFPNPQVGAAC